VKKVIGVCVTVLLLVATFFGVYLSTTQSEAIAAKFSYGPQLIQTVIKSVIPALVKFCIAFEDWGDPDTIMKHTLVRVYILKMATLSFLIYSMETQTNKLDMCVEGATALQFYKLIIVNSVTVAITNIVSFGGTYYLGRKKLGNKAKTQYDHEFVSQAYIDLNYNQGLFLIGVIYAPMLPILWVIMNAFEFFVLVQCLKWFCRLAEKPYESKDANYTLWYLAMTWILCAIPLARFLASAPSQNCALTPSTRCVCGPFDPNIKMKYYALSTFMTDELKWLTGIYDYLLNPMMVYGFILMLAIFIMWTRTQLNNVRSQTVDIQMTNYQMIRDKNRMMKVQREKVRELNQREAEADANANATGGPGTSSEPYNATGCGSGVVWRRAIRPPPGHVHSD